MAFHTRIAHEEQAAEEARKLRPVMPEKAKEELAVNLAFLRAMGGHGWGVPRRR